MTPRFAGSILMLALASFALWLVGGMRAGAGNDQAAWIAFGALFSGHLICCWILLIWIGQTENLPTRLAAAALLLGIPLPLYLVVLLMIDQPDLPVVPMLLLLVACILALGVAALIRRVGSATTQRLLTAAIQIAPLITFWLSRDYHSWTPGSCFLAG